MVQLLQSYSFKLAGSRQQRAAIDIPILVGIEHDIGFDNTLLADEDRIFAALGGESNGKNITAKLATAPIIGKAQATDFIAKCVGVLASAGISLRPGQL